MTTTPCPECAKSVSVSEVACPLCGCPLQRSWTSSLWPRAANRTDNKFALVTVGCALVYLAVHVAGMVNCGAGSLIALSIFSLPLLPVLLVGLSFRIYRTASIGAWITIALFLLMAVGLLWPYYVGETPADAIGLPAGLLILWQGWLVVGFLIVTAIGISIEQKRLTGQRRKKGTL